MPRARVVPPRGRKKSGVREFFGAEASPSGARKRSGRHRHAVRHQRAVAKPGPPHIVRIGTDIFLRRGKCPRRRVRCGGTGRSMWARGTKEANGPGRGRVFRFGAGVARCCPSPHAVIRTLCPGGQSVRLRRTTRRQRPARHGFHQAVCRAKQAGRAPGGDAVLYWPARQPGGATLVPALPRRRNILWCYRSGIKIYRKTIKNTCNSIYPVVY